MCLMHAIELPAASVPGAMTELLPVFASPSWLPEAICSEVNEALLGLQGTSQGSSGYDSAAESIRPVATSQAAGHRPTFSSESPSARWSSHSPSASWGTSQTAGSNQQSVPTNADRSLVNNRAQQSQPSQSAYSSDATHGRERSAATHQVDMSLLENAKQYLPGSGQPRQDSASQGGAASEGNLVSSCP